MDPLGVRINFGCPFSNLVYKGQGSLARVPCKFQGFCSVLFLCKVYNFGQANAVQGSSRSEAATKLQALSAQPETLTPISNLKPTSPEP